MKKIALVFILAVFVPSLVLAWLASRSLRDHQYVLERQQSLLYQGVADSLARDIETLLTERQREFGLQVESLFGKGEPAALASGFDDRIVKEWPLATVGFVVSLDGKMHCPSLFSRPQARQFRMENDKFLCNVESVEVYWNNPKSQLNYDSNGMLVQGNKVSQQDSANQQRINNGRQMTEAQSQGGQQQALQMQMPAQSAGQGGQGGQGLDQLSGSNFLGNSYRGQQVKRSVLPQQALNNSPVDYEDNTLSKVAVAEAEFRQLVGDASEGMLARFLQNKLNLMFWYRSPRDPQLVFGALLNLDQLKEQMREVIKVEPALQKEIAAVLLNDVARPAAKSKSDFECSNWRRPFVATEIGEALPHWEVGVYLLDPARLKQNAATLKFTLGLLVTVLVSAISIGGWLIVRDLDRELALARQKTDFVSNVSHELKTPLTSIRMFSELLAEGRINDEAKQRSYLNIITAETARLTRLINNVLDFARMERGEKKYNLQPCDLAGITRETVESYRPHLETNGFTLECELPGEPLTVQGDRDALAQVLVNLLSNAEKYSTNGARDVSVSARRQAEPIPFVEVKVCDRGPGVPGGCEEKIFEQFYRAHDSLSNGIQGSGLGLTLARQIARAHGGEVAYSAREGGGSCFSLRLPIK